MVRMSESERSELWDLWEAGESQRSISRRLGRSPSTVRTQLVSAGWRRPTRPVEWCGLLTATRMHLAGVPRPDRPGVARQQITPAMLVNE
jgi:hypothetical protein